MKCFPVRLRLVMVAAFAACTVLQGTVAAQDLRLPPVTRVTLTNGIHLILMEYHRAPTVTILATFRGGGANDPPGKAGTAGLAADLMTRGTTNYTAQKLAEEVDFLGASLDVRGGVERTTVSLDLLADSLKTGLALMEEVVRRPQFPQDELDRSRSLVTSSLESLSENPGAVASRVALQTVYGDHPYGRQTTLTSIKAIARDDLVEFYQQYIVPANMTIVAVGDFSGPDLKARLIGAFGDWSAVGGTNPNAVQVKPVRPAPRTFVLVDKPDATQSQVRFVRTGFPRTDAQLMASRLASAALGGGFTSRLVDEVRVNKHLTYNISSRFNTLQAGGEFVVSSFTKLSTTRELIDTINAVLARTAASGLTSAEYSKVRAFLAGQFAISVQTPEALAGLIADNAFYGLPVGNPGTYISRLQHVSAAQLNQIAARWFSPAALSLVVVAPAKAVLPQLRAVAQFRVIPVNDVTK